MIMSDSPNAEEFYKKLKVQLEETATWPSEYLYKFIVLSEGQRIQQIQALFDNTGAVISTIPSKNGKYTSVSINVVMKDPEAVVKKYIEVANNVEGVISL
jgi:putative lipoic acid-binding regulatory protein